MGWTTNDSWTRASLIRERIEGETSRHSGTIRECLHHCYRGSAWKGTLWTVWKLTKVDGKIIYYIGCDLLQCYGGTWGYKDMEAGMGPCQVNCPLSYLLMGPFDYDYEKGTYLEWVGGVLLHYKNRFEYKKQYNSKLKESPLYRKALALYPNAIQAHQDELASRQPFIPKKMVVLSEIVPKELLNL